MFAPRTNLWTVQFVLKAPSLELEAIVSMRMSTMDAVDRKLAGGPNVGLQLLLLPLLLLSLQLLRLQLLLTRKCAQFVLLQASLVVVIVLTEESQQIVDALAVARHLQLLLLPLRLLSLLRLQLLLTREYAQYVLLQARLVVVTALTEESQQIVDASFDLGVASAIRKEPFVRAGVRIATQRISFKQRRLQLSGSRSRSGPVC